MQNHQVVRTAHMNHKGSLFGGQLLQWVDECAYMAAKKDYPGLNLVTRAMSQVEFRKGVVNGSILQFDSNLDHVGNTSVTYQVQVFAFPPNSEGSELVFETTVTFVAIDKEGNKVQIHE